MANLLTLLCTLVLTRFTPFPTFYIPFPLPLSTHFPFLPTSPFYPLPLQPLSTSPLCISSSLLFPLLPPSFSSTLLTQFQERFNADGSGKGIEGRDRIIKGTGSSRGAITNLEFDADEPSPPVSDDEESNEYLAGEVAKLGMLTTNAYTQDRQIKIVKKRKQKS
jgi:hypothetical protein